MSEMFLDGGDLRIKLEKNINSKKETLFHKRIIFVCVFF